LYPLAKRFDGGHQAREFALSSGLTFSLLLLSGQRLLFLFQLVAPPLILGSWDHLHQIRFGQSLKLMAESRLRFAQGLFARL
jgi:hypothetical protein